MPAKRSISVRILGHEYRIRSDGDERSVQRVAAFVDETMAKVRERTKTVDTLDLAVLAALNLANDLLALRETRPAAGESLDPGRLRALIERVEAATASSASR